MAMSCHVRAPSTAIACAMLSWPLALSMRFTTLSSVGAPSAKITSEAETCWPDFR